MRFFCTNMFFLPRKLIMTNQTSCATPRRLCEENLADQELKHITVQPLHFANLSDFSSIVVLMEPALENAIVATDTSCFLIVWSTDIRTNQLPLRCITMEIPSQSLADAFIQSAQKLAGLHRSQE